MNDVIQINEDYEAARYELCSHTSAAVFELAGSIDYFQGLVDDNKSQMLHEYLNAYDSRLTTKFLEARSSAHHSLASQQHHAFLLEKLATVFEDLAPAVEKIAAKHVDPSVEIDAADIEKIALNNPRAFDAMSILHSLNRVREEISTTRREIAEFNKLHATGIAAEMASDDYQRDQGVIEFAVKDLFRASHGQWTPELVTVEDYRGTGKPRDIETPSSSTLGQIAEAVRSGRLRLPPKLLALQNEQ